MIFMKKSNESESTSVELPFRCKVAMIANTDFVADLQGGIQIYVRELSEALRKLDVDTWNFGINSSGRKPESHEIFFADHRVSNFTFFLKLWKKALELRNNGDWVIHVHRPEQIVPFILSKRRQSVVVCTIHGSTKTDVFESKGKIIGGIDSILEMIGVFFSDAIVFVDENTAEAYRRRYKSVRRKSYVVPCGVSPTFFDRQISDGQIEKLGLNDKVRTICYVGRLAVGKNVDLIIRAFAKLHPPEDLLLAIAGDGPFRSELEKLVNDLGLTDNVRFLGQLSRQDVKTLLGTSIALILASSREACPLVVREALASGAKVVSTRVGDVPMMVKDNRFGIIVDNVSEESLAEGLKQLLSNPAERVPRDLLSMLSWDEIAKDIVIIYEKTTKRRKSASRCNAKS